MSSPDLKIPVRVLFVCTGNTCRSPMAEGIMKSLLREGGVKDLHVESAGTFAIDGIPPSEQAKAVCGERGIDIGCHRSRSLTRCIVETTDIILTMELYHLDVVKSLGGEGKAALITDFPPGSGAMAEIEDPIDEGPEAYEAVFDTLEREIRRIIGHLTGQ